MEQCLNVLKNMLGPNSSKIQASVLKIGESNAGVGIIVNTINGDLYRKFKMFVSKDVDDHTNCVLFSMRVIKCLSFEIPQPQNLFSKMNRMNLSPEYKIQVMKYWDTFREQLTLDCSCDDNDIDYKSDSLESSWDDHDTPFEKQYKMRLKNILYSAMFGIGDESDDRYHDDDAKTSKGKGKAKGLQIESETSIKVTKTNKGYNYEKKTKITMNTWNVCDDRDNQDSQDSEDSEPPKKRRRKNTTKI